MYPEPGENQQCYGKFFISTFVSESVRFYRQQAVGTWRSISGGTWKLERGTSSRFALPPARHTLAICYQGGRKALLRLPPAAASAAVYGIISTFMYVIGMGAANP